MNVTRMPNHLFELQPSSIGLITLVRCVQVPFRFEVPYEETSPLRIRVEKPMQADP